MDKKKTSDGMPNDVEYRGECMNNETLGFIAGALAVAMMWLVASGIKMATEPSNVRACGFMEPVKKVQVGNHLSLKDFTYEVSPTSAVVTVKFGPKEVK